MNDLSVMCFLPDGRVAHSKSSSWKVLGVSVAPFVRKTRNSSDISKLILLSGMWKFESSQDNHEVRSLVETPELMRKARNTGLIRDAQSLWDDTFGASGPNSAQSLWTMTPDSRLDLGLQSLECIPVVQTHRESARSDYLLRSCSR